ncbi:MAG: anthranilate phosphoribosyltransferase, partial [candidate division WOR-3 bacterium]
DLVQRQVIGVCKKEFMDKIAGTLKNLGVHHCLVVHGADGMDEMTITDKTYVYEIKDGVSTEYEISPEEFGIDRCRIEELKVRTTEESLNAIAQVLHGVPGPKTDVAVLNAAAVIYVSGKAKSIENGIALARESVLTGSALKKLEGLKRYTNGFSKRNNQ